MNNSPFKQPTGTPKLTRQQSVTLSPTPKNPKRGVGYASNTLKENLPHFSRTSQFLDFFDDSEVNNTLSPVKYSNTNKSKGDEGTTADFFTACKEGHVQVVESMLKGNYVKITKSGSFALGIACEHGHIDIIKVLLDAGVDPSERDNKAIKIALEFKQIEAAKYLLQDSRLDPSDGIFLKRVRIERKWDNESEILFWASKTGSTSIVRLLLQDKRVKPEAARNRSFHSACENGHLDTVIALLEHPSVDPSDDFNISIKSASEFGHLEIVNLLLQYPRVDPSCYENSPIALASENGHLKIVESLLKDKRVDPSDQDNYAIIRASAGGHHEIVILLLKDPRVDPSASKQKALISACLNEHVKCVKILLQDSRVDAKTKDNYCLFIAAQNGYAEVLKLLIDVGGVDPSIQNNKAIKVAVEKKHSETIAVLARDPRVSLAYDLQDSTVAGVMYTALREKQKVKIETEKLESERDAHIRELNETIEKLREEKIELRGIFQMRNEENDASKEAIEKLEGIKRFALHYVQNLTGFLEGNIDPNSTNTVLSNGSDNSNGSNNNK